MVGFCPIRNGVRIERKVLIGSLRCETMQAVLLPNGGLRSLPSLLSPAKTSIHGKKIADFSVHFPLRGGQLQWPNLIIIRSEGSRRKRAQQSRDSSNKPREEGSDELKRRSKSPDNEEILALFRRIQSSISKEGETKVPRRRGHGVADSVSPESKQSTEKGKEVGRRRGSGLEDATALVDSKTQRPLSKFARRSPISVPLPIEEQSFLKKEVEVEKAQEVKEGEEERAGSEVFDIQKIDDMKLSELKDLARGKGIKGISKLKKGELLQLLKEKLKTVLD